MGAGSSVGALEGGLGAIGVAGVEPAVRDARWTPLARSARVCMAASGRSGSCPPEASRWLRSDAMVRRRLMTSRRSCSTSVRRRELRRRAISAAAGVASTTTTTPMMRTSTGAPVRRRRRAVRLDSSDQLGPRCAGSARKVHPNRKGAGGLRPPAPWTETIPARPSRPPVATGRYPRRSREPIHGHPASGTAAEPATAGPASYRRTVGRPA